MESTTMLKRLAVVGLALLSWPVCGKTVKYYHLDALGNVRVVTDQAGAVVERHDYLPFGEECTTGRCASNPGLGVGEPRKFTGKERDGETGLDYFGARYYAQKAGRFTTTDPVYTWRENLVDPQRWNRYAYVRNNPLRYVDPDGRVIDTIWDVANLAYDVYTGVKTGNWTDFGVDLVATAIPFVPAGASKLRHLGKLDEAADLAKGGRNLPPPGGAKPTGGGNGDDLFLPDEYYRKKADDFAPGQWEPNGRYERFDEHGNLSQVTTYDETGRRLRQYDIGPKARHGEGVHTFEYDAKAPRQDPGGGRRSSQVPLAEVK